MSHTLTGNVSSVVGTDDPIDLSLELRCNQSVIPEGETTFLARGRIAATDGVFTAELPEGDEATLWSIRGTWYIRDGGRRVRRYFDSGWFPVTEDLDLADAVTVDTITVSPTLIAQLSVITAEAEALRDEMQVLRDEQVDFSNIDTSDGVMAAVAADEDSDFYAAQAVTLARNATPPLAAHSGEVANEVDGRPVGFLKGAWWGYGSSTGIYRSTDGVTWTSYATAPSGQVQRIIPVGSGDAAVIVTTLAIYKSADFFDPVGASPAFSAAKVSVNGTARHTRFGCSSTPQGRTAGDDGQKLIVAQYGPGSPTFADSRYAYVSLDYGETWTQAWDSDAETTNVAADSHVHGAEYDPYEDVFYVIEGHSTDAGVWRSDDDGATWTLDTGYRMFSAPTCCVATDDGLFLASDDPKAGTLGIPRVGLPANRSIIRTWAWRTGFGSDVLGFGTHAVRDPNTGLVYAAYQSSFALQAPIIAGGTATVGGLVYSYPTPADVAAGDEFNAIALNPSTGVIKAPALIGGARKIVTAYLTRRGQHSTDDPGGTRGGYAGRGTGLAAGAGATTAEYARGTAVGVKARTQQDGVSLGFEAAGDATGVVAIGYQAAGDGAGAVAVGRGADAGALASATVVGDGASTTVASATALGTGAAVTGSFGTALGKGASVVVSGGIALGEAAVAGSGHTNSCALGRAVSTTAGQQVHIGPKHLAMTEMATEPTAPAANDVRGPYALDNGSGVTEVRIRFNGSAAGTVIARQGDLSLLGRQATATLDFPSIAAGGSQELTIALTGAAVGDTVIANPMTTIEAGLIWNVWVSATNTVRIRLTNVTGSAVDPASRDWKVTLIR